MFEVATAILKVPRSVQGIIAEAGCYKGGSTAKLSLLARLTGRRLVAYDSFEGLPDNDESGQTSILGETATFARGAYKGTYDEVVGNVGRCGDASVCRFAKGWFEDTMPHDSEPVVVAFVDVDLTTSTRTCLKYLFPRLARGGVLFSQDGHLPMVIDVLDDDAFWEREMGRAKPPMVGLRTRKLVQIRNDSR